MLTWVTGRTHRLLPSVCEGGGVGRCLQNPKSFSGILGRLRSLSQAWDFCNSAISSGGAYTQGSSPQEVGRCNPIGQQPQVLSSLDRSVKSELN